MSLILVHFNANTLTNSAHVMSVAIPTCRSPEFKWIMQPFIACSICVMCFVKIVKILLSDVLTVITSFIIDK